MTDPTPEDVLHVEKLSRAFYLGTPQEQQAAHEHLRPLFSGPKQLVGLQAVLATSKQPHALIFATTAISKILSQSWRMVADESKEDTKKFVLAYLYDNASDLVKSPYVLNCFLRLVCQIIRQSWLETVSTHNIVQIVNNFLSASTCHWIVGISLYAELTQEIQSSAVGNRNRRVAMSFRETALGDIFRVGLETLKQFSVGSSPVTDRQQEHELLRKVLQLNLNCLSFDFTGQAGGGDPDDHQIVMVPHSWHFAKAENLPDLYLRIYTLCCTAVPKKADCAKMACQCLSLVTALRKSFFPSDDDRKAHLKSLLSGTTTIIQQQIGLEFDDCFHEFCRVIGRINATCQIQDLMELDTFAAWCEELFGFTKKSLEDWRHLPNSKHYLLNFWNNMLTSILSSSENLPSSTIEQYLSDILLTFIGSRLQLAEAVALDPTIDVEDPLTHEVMKNEQLQIIASLSRNRFNDVFIKVAEMFDELQSEFSKSSSLRVLESKMGWIISITAVLLSNFCHLKYRIGQADDSLTMEDSSSDAEALANIFRFMQKTDKSNLVSEKIETSYLLFIEHFRKIFISERTRQRKFLSLTQKVAQILFPAEVDDESLLGLIVYKIFFNLKSRAELESVVKSSLQLFYELTASINVIATHNQFPHLLITGKLLIKNPVVKNVIKDHQASDLTFLNIPGYGKFRTSYYFTLTKLLTLSLDSLDKKESDSRFTEYMMPFKSTYEKLAVAAVNGKLKTEECRNLSIYLTRDLRGIAQALSSPNDYTRLFDWMVQQPKNRQNCRISLFEHLIETWAHDHNVLVPALKFLCEFFLNKSHRITFESSSANGIILFKEVTVLFCAVGKTVLQRKSFSDIYREKYKPLVLALTMFGNALAGGYTNFGVFEVYNDSSLSDALRLGLQMCIEIPDNELQAYMKSLQGYFMFLELVTKSFMHQFMDSGMLAISVILRNVEDGLCGVEFNAELNSCAIIENVTTYFLEKKQEDTQEGMVVRKFLAEQPGSLRRILNMVFHLTISGALTSAWCMSRPLLGLILLHEHDFLRIKEQTISQNIARRSLLERAFEILMDDVENTLTSKNKERFTKNLYQFTQMLKTSE